MKLFLLMMVMVALSACGGSPTRETNRFEQQVISCSGGIINSADLQAKFKAEIAKLNLSADASAGAQYIETFRGVIFADPNASESLKKFYLTSFQNCMAKFLPKPISRREESETFKRLIGTWKGGPVPNIIDHKKKFLLFTFAPDGSLGQKLVYEDNTGVMNNCGLCEKVPYVRGWGRFTVTGHELDIRWDLNNAHEVALLTWLSPKRFKYQVLEHDDESQLHDVYYFSKIS